ncbi:Uncharacterised protein [BD1-7 clade bacterium]|uniref:Peptidase S54 rhomboid domain-containing protein n=1 Tax=BD1-7 clade bacterium TaxID=2029982 RepID=A0A5S9PIP0_9GAMM|nr:Uncharacterised protein [BD1-7 clade bacterium]CAA0104074.1 Uncharacterised protein [BD1-7 clade bacterium]
MARSGTSEKAMSRFTAATVFVAAVWGISILGFAGFLDVIPKLYPRHVSGLWGIATMPFLHVDIPHLLSNTLPLVAFSVLISLRGNSRFIEVTLMIMVIGGGLLWVFGRPYYHVGASGLIFGYFGYLLMRSWYSPSLSSVVISVAVILIYGGLIWGILPQGRNVSWDGHLMGLIAGVLVARLSSTRHSGNKR